MMMDKVDSVHPNFFSTKANFTFLHVHRAKMCDERIIYIYGIILTRPLIISAILLTTDYIFLTFDLCLAHICAKLYGANVENVCILRNSRVYNFPIVYKHLSMNVYRFYLRKLCARFVPFASKAILENWNLLHFE